MGRLPYLRSRKNWFNGFMIGSRSNEENPASSARRRAPFSPITVPNPPPPADARFCQVGDDVRVRLRRSIGRIAALVVLSLALTAGLPAVGDDAAAGRAVVSCPAVLGYAVYANGVTCPTARKLVRTISARPYRAPKVTIRTLPGWLCVASYSKRMRTQLAGSCLKTGTVATGFGWTKGGATVPLPPGVSQPPPPSSPPPGS